MKEVVRVLKEHILAVLFIALMGGVYIFTMFTNGPWYDELYTYYYFISRGPVYAAIHWPVPNNHVGYSVVSAFFDYLGNPYIGLRGVSCLAAIANLILIYRFLLEFIDKRLSLAASALYAGAYLVHRLSVQGRGYTLATTCLIVGVFSCYHICIGIYEKKDFFLFSFCLAFGLYIVPSSLYFVLPLCITGGLYLLITQQNKLLLRLFLAGVYAAVATFLLYSIIWLAIGANLISKDSSGAFYRLNQVKVILKAPFLSLKTGIDYMTATPYIQSIDRLSCISGLPVYFKELFDNFYDRMGICVLVITLIVFIGNLVLLVLKRKNADKEFFASLFAVCFIFFVPLMLLIQSVHPYKRVLSFLMVPIVTAIGIMLNKLILMIKESKVKLTIQVLTAICCLVFAVINVFSSYYRAPLADKENELEALFEKIDTSMIDTIYYTDDYQKYVLKFYHDITPVEVDNISEADYVVIGPQQRDESYVEPIWPVFDPYSSELLLEIDEKMVEVGRAGNYTIYARKNNE